MTDYSKFWDKSWECEDIKELEKYLDGYYKLESKELDIFKENGITNICDAACGFGAYTLAFLANGFNVKAGDISPRSIEITKNLLKKYNLNAKDLSVRDILNTGYQDLEFDGVIAHAVIDHLTVEDAKKAINELSRITKKNGLIMLSFDKASSDDLSEKHDLLEDGTMLYSSGSLEGMLFHPYDEKKIKELLNGYNIIYQDETRRERVVIIRK